MDVNVSGRILALDVGASTADVLRRAGYQVTMAASAASAARSMQESPPDLVLIEVRPATFCGLPLLRQPHALPRIATIVMTPAPEPFVEAEARRHHAVYLVKPADWGEFLAAVAAQVHAPHRQRRWPRWAAGGRVAARVGRSDAVVLDVSYDGLRFEIPPPAVENLSSPIEVQLIDRPLTLAAQPVWTRRTARGTVWCGARLLAAERQMAAWRSTVDAVADVA